ncbi:Holliday junction branch migration protein RuvA [Corynebacterium bovis]|uniref:Holliday junction branch migration protein RuvA n=2 Tax=Corynebacterium bovis TaxID=36808 RepID=UPI003138C459
MIASLRGTVVDKGLDHVVIECGGVGYLCQATPRTLADLPRGGEAHVLTTMVVREDSQTLYAFPDAATREVFGVVQSVSGVGARLAMGIMSVLSPGELADAVAAGDVKALQKAPGVGKRLAERMAVDLRGKLDAFAGTAPATAAGTGSGAPDVAAGAVGAQVVEALTGLGFSRDAAEAVVGEVAAAEPGADTGTLLRLSLARIGGGAR